MKIEAPKPVHANLIIKFRPSGPGKRNGESFRSFITCFGAVVHIPLADLKLEGRRECLKSTNLIAIQRANPSTNQPTNQLKEVLPQIDEGGAVELVVYV